MKYAGRCLAILAVFVLLAGGTADAHRRRGFTIVVPVGGASVVVSSRPVCSTPYTYGYSYPYSYPYNNCNNYSYTPPCNTYPAYSYPTYTYPVYSYPVYRRAYGGRWHHGGWGRSHRR